MSNEDTEAVDVDLDHEALHDQQGRRITDTEVSRSAEALEDGDVEVDETSVIYPRGRPSLSGPHTRSPRVDARVPSTVKDHLDRLAHQQGRRESDVVREALDEYLARH